MRICAKEKCNNPVPKYYITDDGKKHNCQKRKFCIECSPFGLHNTKNLNNKNTGICSKCGNQSQKGKQLCYSCYFNDRLVKISKRVYDIIGYDCWYCGYDKGISGQSMLDFHHIDPKNKLFNLSTRETVGHSWNRVKEELQKCVSLCCRCHREYHYGLISDSIINDIYKSKWIDINNDINKMMLLNNKKEGRICAICNNEFFKYTKYCSSECCEIGKRKVKDRPSKEQLLKEIEKTNYCIVGKEYGVSDNTIRKWIK